VELGDSMRFMFHVLVCAVVLLSGCRDQRNGFERAVGLRLPDGLRIEHEYYFSRWEYKGDYYSCVLLGDQTAFMGLVQMLDLVPSRGRPLVHFSRIESGGTSLVKPHFTA